MSRNTLLYISGGSIVPGPAAIAPIQDGTVVVKDGIITYCGPAHVAPPPPEIASVIDLEGGIAAPGLINAHCHAGDTLFRGLVEDLPLEPWLQQVWKAEGAVLTRDRTRLGVTLGFAELVLGGVTTVLDMFWYPSETAAVARQLGLRLCAGPNFFDPPGLGSGDISKQVRDADAFFREHSGSEWVFPAAMPHSAYTVEPGKLKKAKAVADAHDALFHIHAAETRAEQKTVAERYGTSVLRHLATNELLGARTSLAHCVHLDTEEMDILAQSGSTVVHNPVSNLKLASGFADIRALRSRDIPIALGTDGAISGNDLDMWLALRLAAILPRAVHEDAQAVSAAEAFEMATLGGAHAVGQQAQLGSLEVGKRADLIILDRVAPSGAPMFDPRAHLVFATAKSDIRHVIVNGAFVVKDKHLLGVDLGQVRAQVEDLVPFIRDSINDQRRDAL